MWKIDFVPKIRKLAGRQNYQKFNQKHAHCLDDKSLFIGDKITGKLYNVYWKINIISPE